MQFAELKQLKENEVMAQAITNAALQELTKKMAEFSVGFKVEAAAWMTVLDYVPKPEQGKKNYSIHPEFGGLQLQLVMRARPHTEDPKKFGVLQVDVLDAGEKIFIRSQINPRGNENMTDLFKDRFVEFLQGEINLFENVEQLS